MSYNNSASEEVYWSYALTNGKSATIVSSLHQRLELRHRPKGTDCMAAESDPSRGGVVVAYVAGIETRDPSISPEPSVSGMEHVFRKNGLSLSDGSSLLGLPEVMAGALRSPKIYPRILCLVFQDTMDPPPAILLSTRQYPYEGLSSLVYDHSLFWIPDDQLYSQLKMQAYQQQLRDVDFDQVDVGEKAWFGAWTQVVLSNGIRTYAAVASGRSLNQVAKKAAKHVGIEIDEDAFAIDLRAVSMRRVKGLLARRERAIAGLKQESAHVVLEFFPAGKNQSTWSHEERLEESVSDALFLAVAKKSISEYLQGLKCPPVEKFSRSLDLTDRPL